MLLYCDAYKRLCMSSVFDVIDEFKCCSIPLASTSNPS